MNLLLILLNKTALFLTKCGNNQPVLSASLLVSYLLWTILFDILICVYVIFGIYYEVEYWQLYLSAIIVFVLIGVFSKKNYSEIRHKRYSLKCGVLVVFIWISSILLFLGNVNKNNEIKTERGKSKNENNTIEIQSVYIE